MRVEKLGENKVRIYLSYEDLNDRGIDRDEIWQNGGRIQDLFWEMMETAYEEVGFEVAGPIAVEAITKPTEGIVGIVTQLPSFPNASGERGPEEEADDAESNLATADLIEAFIFVFQV